MDGHRAGSAWALTVASTASFPCVLGSIFLVQEYPESQKSAENLQWYAIQTFPSPAPALTKSSTSSSGVNLYVYGALVNVPTCVILTVAFPQSFAVTSQYLIPQSVCT